MPATWPSGVPYRLLRQGAAFTPPERVIRSQTDSGLARQRAAFTAGLDKFNGTIRMSEAELADFIPWRDGLGGGTFTWAGHPTAGGSVEARFVGGEQGAAQPDSQTPKWLVPVSIEVIG